MTGGEGRSTSYADADAAARWDEPDEMAATLRRYADAGHQPRPARARPDHRRVNRGVRSRSSPRSI